MMTHNYVKLISLYHKVNNIEFSVELLRTMTTEDFLSSFAHVPNVKNVATQLEEFLKKETEEVINAKPKKKGKWKR